MPVTNEVLVNGRILNVKSNGQKRVAEELINRIPGLTIASPPPRRSSGAMGHAWEQFVLPVLAKGKPLWSPSTSGPLIHHNQIVTIHDIAFLDVPEYFGKNFASWYSLMIKTLTKTVRHIVSVSDFTKQRLVDRLGVDATKITTIYPGVSASFKIQTAHDVERVLREFNLSGVRFILGFFGSDPRKNTNQLIQAWKISEAASNNCRLVLFGRSANLSVFANQGATSDAQGVVYVNDVDDRKLACLFTAASGFVFPSYYEGFGLPVVEAASCGCRVVTSRISSLPEVCPKDANLVDPNNAGEIASAICWLLANDDSTEGKERRVRDMEIFSWDGAAAKYSEVFRSAFL